MSLETNKAMENVRLLVIDDDITICKLLTFDFGRLGAKVYTANLGEEGIEKLKQFDPHAVLLDITIPGMDGLDVCRKIRTFSEVPILFLSAISQQNVIVRGLELGGDDYITKPFNTQILVARVQALIRRARQMARTQSRYYEDHYLVIDLDQRQIKVRGEDKKLSTTEFDILADLLKSAGQVRTYAQILEAVWGAHYLNSPEYVHTYIHHIRNKLEKNPKEPVYFLTEHKIGYRFSPQNSSS